MLTNSADLSLRINISQLSFEKSVQKRRHRLIRWHIDFISAADIYKASYYRSCKQPIDKKNREDACRKGSYYRSFKQPIDKNNREDACGRELLSLM